MRSTYFLHNNCTHDEISLFLITQLIKQDVNYIFQKIISKSHKCRVLNILNGPIISKILGGVRQIKLKLLWYYEL